MTIGEGQTPLRGIWSVTDSLGIVDMLAKSGYDYLCIDLQHGRAHSDQLPDMARSAKAAGVLFAVRVPWNRPEAIMYAADSGAERIVVPMVNTGAEAASAVAATLYPPQGVRSWGPFWQSETLPPSDANRSIECFVMIETALGLANLEEIVCTEGLSGVYIGPNDLALATGYGRATYEDTPEIAEMIQRIVDACNRHGIVAGLHCSSAAMARHWAQRGVGMLTVATDSALFESAARAAAALDAAAPSSGARTGY